MHPMSESSGWAEVDDYIVAHLVGHDDVLEAAMADAASGGLPPIAVSPAQGKFLHLFAKSLGAERILELGTLGGYSTIWLARALPETGRLISLEVNPHHAEVAGASIARAGLADKVEIRVGAALGTLPKLGEEIERGTLFDGKPFDLAFIDADKVNIPAYFDYAAKYCRPGGAIIVDNVIRGGRLADAGTAKTDDAVRGVRELHEMLAKRADVSATTIQTVGAKGYDGFTLAIVGG